MKKRTSIYLSLSVCMALLVFSGCSSTDTSKKETADSKAQTTEVKSADSKKQKLLAENNWYPKNREALNKVIEEYGKNSKDYDAESKPYAVFDWDNTTIINDIGEAVFTHQIENLKFKMTPEEFTKAVNMNIPADDFGESWNNKAGEAVNIEKISQDLTSDYTFIHENYKEFSGDKELKEIKETDQYRDFSAKIRYLYDAIGDSFSPDISYPWVTYMFTGMTDEEVQKVSKEAIDESLAAPLKTETWESPKELTGTAGQVSVEFKTGVRTVKEMQNLYKTLMDNGIDVYVCSASFIDVIIPFATNPAYGYNVPENHVYAMQLEKKDGVIQTQFNTKYEQTQGAGKTATIKEHIMPEHDNKGPVIVAGDSNGDVAMLSDFPDTEVGLIFNRQKSGDIGKLCQEAIDTTGKKDQRYYLQGRDENKGVLIDKSETVLLGEKTAKLTK